MCTQLDGHTSAPLSLLLIPLWILDGLGLLLLYALTFASAREGPAARRMAVLLVLLLLYVAFEVLLVCRVDGAAPTLPWAAVFAPVYAAFAIHLVRATRRCVPSAFETERAGGTAAADAYGWHVALTLGWPLACIAALTMSVLNLSGVTAINWALVFTPVFAYVGFYVTFACNQLRVQPTSEREQVLQMGQRLSVCFVLFLTLLLLLAALIAMGTIHTWLPFFIFPFLISGCFCWCASAHLTRKLPLKSAFTFSALCWLLPPPASATTATRLRLHPPPAPTSADGRLRQQPLRRQPPRGHALNGAGRITLRSCCCTIVLCIRMQSSGAPVDVPPGDGMPTAEASKGSRCAQCGHASTALGAVCLPLTFEGLSSAPADGFLITVCCLL